MPLCYSHTLKIPEVLSGGPQKELVPRVCLQHWQQRAPRPLISPGTDLTVMLPIPQALGIFSSPNSSPSLLQAPPPLSPERLEVGLHKLFLLYPLGLGKQCGHSKTVTHENDSEAQAICITRTRENRKY